MKISNLEDDNVVDQELTEEQQQQEIPEKLESC